MPAFFDPISSHARWPRIAIILSALTLGTLAFLEPHILSDTVQVVQGGTQAVGCLRSGVLVGCPGVRHFAPFQYIPATVFYLLGASEEVNLQCLTLLNFLAIAGAFFTLFRHFQRRSPIRAWISVLVLSSSPIIYYARSSFGEAIAAFVTLAFALSCWRAGSWIEIAAWALLCCLTKETVPPFAALLALCAAAIARHEASRLRRMFIGLGVGLGLGSAACALFNVFRFGSPFNPFYLDPIYRTSGVWEPVSHFFGLFLSLNGGLVFFWPSFCILLAIALADSRRPRSVRILPGGLLILLLAGMAQWYTPFGWNAWGPRFLMPWAPALVLLALECAGDGALERISALLRRRLAGPIALLLLWTVSLPNALLFVDASPVLKLSSTFAECPKNLPIESDPAYYRGCLSQKIWTRHEPIWVDLYRNLPGEPVLLAFAAAYAMALLGIARKAGSSRTRKSELEDRAAMASTPFVSPGEAE